MPIPEVSVAELAELLATGPVVLIDVRQPEEFAEARVPAASLIPLTEIPVRLDQVPEGERVYLICRSGGRSLNAAQFLAERGRDVVNVAGGTLAWVHSGYEVASGAPS
jgi:rhodanese-related sulfurtransferase